MLINYVPGEECRIGIVVDDRLEEFYHERPSAESHVGSIYQGVVTNVERSIQAAFIDFGLERNGFLHISDLHPMYFPGPDREEFEQVGSKTPRRDRPPIEKCLKRGQQVLVQVLKEGISSKGPTLTSYLSIPGRFIVMMPYMQRLGVTRKIEDEEVRRQMRDLLKELDPPKEFGFIVRTAGIGQTKTDLKRDLAYLQRLWKNIESRRKQIKRTGELYSESDLIIRTIRDVFTNDIDRIVVDNLDAARRVRNFLAIASPRTKSRVVYYDDPIPLFTRFGIEAQLELINQRQVPLPSGGSLVIDQAEALVAIDVNSGKSRDARNAEENAYQTNLEAVDEIARQLKLRDLGGVVINDLIDMRSNKHRKAVEQRFRDNLKKDRARTRVGTISSFGILEMTRQRMRPSLKSALYVPCPNCQGQGQVRSAESVLLMVMRRLAVTMNRSDVVRVELVVSPDVAFHLLNRKRLDLADLERRHNKRVLVRVGGQSIDHLMIHAFDERSIEVDSSPEANRARISTTCEQTFRELDDPSLPPEMDPPVQPEPDLDDEEDENSLSAVAEAAEVGSGEQVNDAPSESDDSDRASLEEEVSEDGAAPENGSEGEERNGRRRRRRGGRRRRKQGENDVAPAADASAGEPITEAELAPTSSQEESDASSLEAEASDSPAARDALDHSEKSDSSNGSTEAGDSGEAGEGAPRKKPRRRRRRRRRSDASVEGAAKEMTDGTTEEIADGVSEDTAGGPGEVAADDPGDVFEAQNAESEHAAAQEKEEDASVADAVLPEDSSPSEPLPFDADRSPALDRPAQAPRKALDTAESAALPWKEASADHPDTADSTLLAESRSSQASASSSAEDPAFQKRQEVPAAAPARTRAPESKAQAEAEYAEPQALKPLMPAREEPASKERENASTAAAEAEPISPQRAKVEEAAPPAASFSQEKAPQPESPLSEPLQPPLTKAGSAGSSDPVAAPPAPEASGGASDLKPVQPIMPVASEAGIGASSEEALPTSSEQPVPADTELEEAPKPRVRKKRASRKKVTARAGQAKAGNESSETSEQEKPADTDGAPA